MPSFIMLTRVAPERLRSPSAFEELEKQVENRIHRDCPGVEWRASFAVLGPYDYVDLFDAPDTETAFKVAAIVRSLGHSYTEVWAGTDWQRFKTLMRELSSHGPSSSRGKEGS